MNYMLPGMLLELRSLVCCFPYLTEKINC